MIIVRELTNLPVEEKYVLTLGNFDGVHLGHQFLIKELVKKSKEQGAKSVVFTFRPHPSSFLVESSNYLINSYEERRDLLSRSGIDYLYEIKFDHFLSKMTPGDFCSNFFLSISGLLEIFLGHDFKFGFQKKGDFNFVEMYLRGTKIKVSRGEPFSRDSDRVSSSLIRECLKSGKLDLANVFLGRPFSLTGVIVKGRELGGKIGYPTANLFNSKDRIVPAVGTYITKVKFESDFFWGVTNVGLCPTVSTENEISIETHILDFSGDLYGKKITIEFVSFLRKEMKFDNVEDLKSAISGDIDKCRSYFNEKS